MDSRDQILHNVVHVLGCNGVRRLRDVGAMRQETMERRLAAARDQLSPAGMVSIYAVWLQEQAVRARGLPPAHVVARFAWFLAQRGCGRRLLTTVWLNAALGALDAWLEVMQPERVRNVRMAVFDEIRDVYPEGAEEVSARGPVDADRRSRRSASAASSVSGGGGPASGNETSKRSDSQRDGTASKVDSDHGIIPIFAALSLTDHGLDQTKLSCTICGSHGEHSTEACPGRQFGYEPRPFPDSFNPLPAPVSPQLPVPSRQTRAGSGPDMRDGPSGDNHGKPDDVSTTGKKNNAADLFDGGDASGGQQHKLKPLHLMTPVEREALRRADEFLATLSWEAEEKQKRGDPAGPVEKAAPKELPRPGRDRIPMQGELAEPAKPKAAPRGQTAAAAPEPADARIIPGVTLKPLPTDSPHSAAIQELFKNHKNFWGERVKRKTALEMWDELDAKAAAAEEKRKAEEEAKKAAAAAAGSEAADGEKDTEMEG
ncbi:hypothetical protein CDD83_1427 [Cordyceps sp. RAO-2017]|nr:hypothetical protein CDD83_1427 [Cordyceps sp. RAO-2017]